MNDITRDSNMTEQHLHQVEEKKILVFVLFGWLDRWLGHEMTSIMPFFFWRPENNPDITIITCPANKIQYRSRTVFVLNDEMIPRALYDDDEQKKKEPGENDA